MRKTVFFTAVALFLLGFGGYAGSQASLSSILAASDTPKCCQNHAACCPGSSCCTGGKHSEHASDLR